MWQIHTNSVCCIFAQLFGTCQDHRNWLQPNGPCDAWQVWWARHGQAFSLTFDAQEKSGWRAGGETERLSLLQTVSNTSTLWTPAKDELGRVRNQSGLTGNLCYHRLCEMAQARGSTWTLGCSTIVVISYGLVEFKRVGERWWYHLY